MFRGEKKETVIYLPVHFNLNKKVRPFSWTHPIKSKFLVKSKLALRKSKIKYSYPMTNQQIPSILRHSIYYAKGLGNTQPFHVQYFAMDWPLQIGQ